MIDFIHARNAFTGEILTDIDAFQEVPPKFLPLICELVERLAPLVEALGEDAKDFFFLQAKEKYGELRLYPSFYTPEIEALLEEIEDRSREVK